MPNKKGGHTPGVTAFRINRKNGMDDDETTPEETPEESPEESAPEAAETPEADAILSSVYEAKIATLTAENISLTTALVQAKADNYDLLMSQAASVEPESSADPEDESDDELDAAFL